MILALLQQAASHVVANTQHTAPVVQAGFESITLGNIIGAGGVCVALFGVWYNLDKRNRDLAKDAREDNDRLMKKMSDVSNTFDTRVDRLEQKSADFMPRSEIVAKIKHVEAGAAQIAQTAKERLDKQDAAIIELRVSLGKVEEAHKNLDDDVSEIKNILKDQRREQNERLDRQDGKLDKLQDCLNVIVQRVGPSGA